MTPLLWFLFGALTGCAVGVLAMAMVQVNKK